MTQEQLRNLSTIIGVYGYEPQVDMAVEECSELIKALMKFRRNGKQCNCSDDVERIKECREAVIDEIADVSIMVAQLQIIFGCMGEVEECIDFKINRQLQRIKEKEACTNACEVAGRNDSSE